MTKISVNLWGHNKLRISKRQWIKTESQIVLYTELNNLSNQTNNHVTRYRIHWYVMSIILKRCGT